VRRVRDGNVRRSEKKEKRCLPRDLNQTDKEKNRVKSLQDQTDDGGEGGDAGQPGENMG